MEKPKSVKAPLQARTQYQTALFDGTGQRKVRGAMTSAKDGNRKVVIQSSRPLIRGLWERLSKPDTTLFTPDCSIAEEDGFTLISVRVVYHIIFQDTEPGANVPLES